MKHIKSRHVSLRYHFELIQTYIFVKSGIFIEMITFILNSEFFQVFLLLFIEIIMKLQVETY